MKKIAFIVLCACAFASEATQYSKLSVITAAKRLGKWDALKAWIAAAGIADEFQNCAYLSDDYPQYSALTNALVSGGVLTGEEVETILAASKDTSIPDELLRRVYSQDMSNDTGRVRWHGKCSNVVYDTNALTKTIIYADGYQFVVPFQPNRPPSIKDQLTAAERKAIADRRKAEQAARAAAQKQARIDLLTTNMTAEVSALMALKQWPEELARLYLQDELNKLIGTNVVDAVITPGR